MLTSEEWRGLSGLLLKLYDLAYIERWNDHPKPFHITELDKQAHKTAIAYIVGRFEEEIRNKKLDWERIIESIIFEALQRAVLTDIKPQIFHRLLKEKKKEINEYVFEEVGKFLKDFDAELYRRFTEYFEKDEVSLERRIVRASHFMATYWEFQMIYSVGIRFYGIEKVKEEIESTIEDYIDLAGIERIYLKKKTFNFIDLVGQLRFQKRWILSPRIPATTVLGHMFIVATLSYLLSLKINACWKRKFLNFFTGLFHDLPEVTTRDIIAPVKERTNIKEIIKKYEEEQVNRLILPLLPDFLRDEFAYILGFSEGLEGDEFACRVMVNGEVKKLEEIPDNFNSEKYNPVDGKLVKVCDHIGAYMEAKLSMFHGIRSKHLSRGAGTLEEKISSYSYRGIDFSEFIKIMNRVLEDELF